MLRGTFANVRIKNLMVPGTEGGVTVLQPVGEQMSIYDASVNYSSASIPLIVIAGQEYGTGSSRDWAAKGTRLLGVKAVVAKALRAYTANLVGMGILPVIKEASQRRRSALTARRNSTSSVLRCEKVDRDRMSRSSFIARAARAKKAQSRCGLIRRLR